MISEHENALFMAKRVMKRNLERAEDALQSADKDDLLKGIIAECKAWLRDYEPLPDATNTPPAAPAGSEIAKRANQVLKLLVFHSSPDIVDCVHTDDGFWEYRWYYDWNKPFYMAKRIADETLANMDVTMAAFLVLNTP